MRKFCPYYHPENVRESLRPTIQRHLQIFNAGRNAGNADALPAHVTDASAIDEGTILEAEDTPLEYVLAGLATRVISPDTPRHDFPAQTNTDGDPNMMHMLMDQTVTTVLARATRSAMNNETPLQRMLYKLLFEIYDFAYRHHVAPRWHGCMTFHMHCGRQSGRNPGENT